MPQKKQKMRVHHTTTPIMIIIQYTVHHTEVNHRTRCYKKLQHVLVVLFMGVDRSKLLGHNRKF